MNKSPFTLALLAGIAAAGHSPNFFPVMRAPIGTLEPRKWRKRFGARNARGPKPGWRKR